MIPKEQSYKTIEDIIQNIQEHVVGKVGYVRRIGPFDFAPRIEMTINSEPISIFLSVYLINDVSQFKMEIVHAVLYEIRRLNPDYLKPDYKHPSDDKQFRSS
jgi:L-cystine uptake protein TcyP (sodium:dicarboxylate symporter family)